MKLEIEVDWNKIMEDIDCLLSANAPYSDIGPKLKRHQIDYVKVNLVE